MKQTLETLWHGGIAPGQTCGVRDPQIERLTVLLGRHRECLGKELDGRQKETFQKYADCADEFAGLISMRAFCDGFVLAGRLLMEALSDQT